MTTEIERRQRLEHRYDDLMWTVERDSRSEGGWSPMPSKTYNRLDRVLEFIAASVAGDEAENIDPLQISGELQALIRETIIDRVVAHITYVPEAVA